MTYDNFAMRLLCNHVSFLVKFLILNFWCVSFD